MTNKRIEFTPAEIKILASIPNVLDELADWHNLQQQMAEAMDYECTGNQSRADQLKAEAKRLEARYDNGDDEGFTE
jgi:phage shock protein A